VSRRAWALCALLAEVVALSASCLAADGDAVLAQAREHWAANRYQEAADAYRELRDEHPDHEFVRSGNAQFWLWACLGNAGRKADEIREIEAFLRDYPDHRSCGYALYFLGAARSELGDAKGAEEAWKQLLERYPNDAMAPHARAALGEAMPAAVRDPTRELGSDYLTYAIGAGEWLKAIAEPVDGGLAWPEYGGQKAHPVSFYSGAAGVCLFFLNLRELTGKDEYTDLARQAAAFLSSRASPANGGLVWEDEEERDDGSVVRSSSPGLYTGATGIGYVFLSLYRTLGDTAYLQTARGAADGLVASAIEGHWGEDTDIISGAAGVALFLLEMHRETGDSPYLDCARAIAEWLITQGEVNGAGTRWRAAASLPRYYTGFSHGTAGIAYSLARIYEATGERRFLEAAERGARWLEENAVPAAGELKWFHYAPGRVDKHQTGWCHGPAGTCRLFLTLHGMTGKPEYLDIAKRGAAWLMSTAMPAGGDPAFWGLSMCCGATGIADFVLDLYFATGDDRYLEYAGAVAGHLMREAKPDGNGFKWTNYDRPDEHGIVYYGTGHMIGAAGVGTLFLKLHAVLSNRQDLLITFADKPGAPTSEPPAAEGHYVVLTNVPEDDPYFEAAARLATLRQGTIVRFDPDRPLSLRRTLSALQPRYVALVLRPESIDANLQRRMVALSTRMDDDPFGDFAFGFITGPTPEDAVGLVERAAEVERTGLPKRMVSASVTTGDTSRVIEAVDSPLAAAQGYEGESIYWACREDDPNVLDFVPGALKRLEGNGVVGLFGCGDPEGIWLFHDERNFDDSKHWDFDPSKVGQDPAGEMPRITAEMLRGLDLGSAVVWSGTCHSAVLRRAFVEGDIVSTFGRVDRVTEYTVPADRGLALAILAARPSAFLAPIGPNHGYACLPEMYRALSTGMPLGDVMRTRYNEIILAAAGRLDGQLYEPGGPELTEDPMRGGGLNRTLLGDPAYRPFPAAETNYLRTTVERTAEGLIARCEVVDTSSGMFWDMFGDDRANPERVYTAIALPEGTTSVKDVQAVATSPDGQEVSLAGCLWAIEAIDGKRLLHMQANAPRGALQAEGTVVEFAVACKAGR